MFFVFGESSSIIVLNALRGSLGHGLTLHILLPVISEAESSSGRQFSSGRVTWSAEIHWKKQAGLTRDLGAPQARRKKGKTVWK